MRRNNKRSFSMIEILVAMTLFVGLLSILSFWKIKMVRQTRDNEQIINIFLQEDLAYKRMRSIFDHRDKIKPFLLLNDKSCSLIFDRGVSFSPQLSNKVRAVFQYLLEERVIKVIIENSSNLLPNICEEIVLLDNVDDVHWECLSDNSEIKGGDFLGIKVSFRRSALFGIPSRTLTYIF